MGSEWDELYDDGPESIPEMDELLREGVELDDAHVHTVQQEMPGLISEQIYHVQTAEASEESEDVIGEPTEDMEHWHLQSEDTSCAVACQEFVADELLDQDFAEKDLIRLARENGWYADGTSMQDVGNLLEALGLDVDREFDCSFDEIEKTLADGGKVIAAVNNDLLALPELAFLPFFDANHAVEVIGVDERDPAHVKVILNDPGVKEGRGIEVEKDDFLQAWKTSDNYAVTVYSPAVLAQG